MEEKRKVGFFKRILLSISDFRLYPYALKEHTAKAFGYFFKLTAICSVILSAYIMSLTLDFISDGVEELDKKLPNFEIVDGQMKFSGDASVEVNPYLTVVMKNDYAENVSLSQYTSDRMYFVATKDKLLFGNSSSEESISETEYKEIPDMTKQQMIAEFYSINESLTYKLAVYGFLFIIVYLYMIINRLWMLMMYILVIMICNSLFVVKLKFKDLVKISIYISTLPMLLETFAIAIGGKYSQAAEFITFLIAGVYAFYALRAIRLDDILLKATGNTPEEKIANAIKDAQKQLEKQLEETEREGKREDDKKKEEEKSTEEQSVEELKSEEQEEKNEEQDDEKKE